MEYNDTETHDECSEKQPETRKMEADGEVLLERIEI